MRIRVLIAGLVLSGAAWSQEQPAPRGDLGVRYWVSSGESKRAHNAQSFDPSLGNPTSVLLYENLDANTIELFGRQYFGGGKWLVKGFIGLGEITRGSFRDEDFSAGQVKFSETTSSVSAGEISYGAIDIGRNVWRLRDGRTLVGLYVGYSEWKEEVDAHGATDHLGFIGGDIPSDVLVITNKVVWKALRVGFAGNLALTERMRLDIDLALVPYAKVRNDDSHHLRADPTLNDLGPVPNILIEGRGYGVQLDAELRYEIVRRTELGLGVRYWYLETTSSATRSLPNRPDVPELPVTDFYSERFGATLSLRRVW
ncbi:MAG TPA: hypothetical protein VF280_19795 [Burkholderiales bacterium]